MTASTTPIERNIIRAIFQAYDQQPSSLCNGQGRSQRFVTAPSQSLVIRRLPCAISVTIPIKSEFLRC
jgi:hypothetical protein